MQNTNLGGIITNQTECSITKQRRSFSQQFKLDSAKLVLDKGYSLQEAARSLEVGETALRAGLSNYNMSVVEQHQTLKHLPLGN